MTDFNGACDWHLMVNATAFALSAAAHQHLIHLDRPHCADPVLIRAGAPCRHAACGVSGRRSRKLALKLNDRHAGRLCRHQIRVQESRMQGRPRHMHNGASGQRHVTMAMAAPQYLRSRHHTLRFTAHAAFRTSQSVRPTYRLKIGRALPLITKNPLKPKQRLGLAYLHDSHTLPIVVRRVNRTRLD